MENSARQDSFLLQFAKTYSNIESYKRKFRAFVQVIFPTKQFPEKFQEKEKHG